MEIVQVNLAARVKFVKEVKQAECEGGARSLPGSREPSGAEQLDTWWNPQTFRHAFAVGHVDSMDTSDIKDREGDGRGGYSAGTSKAVAEVKNSVKVSRRYSREVGSSPTLRGSQYLRESNVELEYLEAVERFTVVK